MVKKLLCLFCAVILAATALMLTACRLPLPNGSREQQKENADAHMTALCLKPANGYDPSADELRLAEKYVNIIIDRELLHDHSAEADNAEKQIVVRYSEQEPQDSVERMKNALTQEGGKLTFRAGKSFETTEIDAEGRQIFKSPADESKTVLMDGSAVDRAEAHYYMSDEADGELKYVVTITLNEQGAQTFEKITEAYLNRSVSVWLDDVMLTAPTVYAVIADGELQISGDFSAAEAQELADKINLGLIPFQMTIAD